MSQTEIIKVPDLGGAAQVDVIEVMVQAGDQIELDQGLMTVEGDKASMDIPAPIIGTVSRVLVKVGDQVSEGDDLFEVTTESSKSNDVPVVSDTPQEPEMPSNAALESITVYVPDLGGAAQVDVIEQHVHVGDTIALDAPLFTVEGDKASMDIPSTASGVVTEVCAKVGDQVKEGDALIHMQTQSESASAPVVAENTPKEAVTSPDVAPTEVTMTIPDLGGAAQVDVIEVHVKPGDQIEKEAAIATLEGDKASMEVPATHSGEILSVHVSVGDKVSEQDAMVTVKTTATQKVTQEQVPTSAPKKPAASAVQQTPAPSQHTPLAPEAMNKISFGAVHASPSVRRFARDLGVDLTQVKGSGPKGRVTQKDVQSFVKGVMTGASTPKAAAPVAKTMTVDFSEFGETTHEPFNKIKRMTGKHMDFCWTTIPHVTQFGEADITDMEAFRQEHKDEAKASGIRLTPLAFITQVLGQTLQEFPHFNASLDPSGEGLILKHYTNIGIAVETPNGLVVPVIRDVMDQSIMSIAEAMGDISKKARDGALTANDMKGGSMTISSLGGIGGTAFTPIVNAPEVAILGVSKSYMKPVYQNGEFVPRLMLPLSLSYDHRVIDGAEGARFLTRFSELLGDIRNLLLV